MNHFPAILKAIKSDEFDFLVNHEQNFDLGEYYIHYDYSSRYNYGQYQSGTKIDRIDIVLTECKFFDADDNELTFTPDEHDVLFKALAKRIWSDEEVEVTQDDELPSQKYGF